LMQKMTSTSSDLPWYRAIYFSKNKAEPKLRFVIGTGFALMNQYGECDAHLIPFPKWYPHRSTRVGRWGFFSPLHAATYRNRWTGAGLESVGYLTTQPWAFCQIWPLSKASLRRTILVNLLNLMWLPIF
jgi:hypothetical protein